MMISCSDHAPIMLGLSSNRLYIGGSNSGKSIIQNFVGGAVFGEVGG